MEKFKLVCFCALTLSLGLVYSQDAQSPCPGIFDYVPDRSGKIHGQVVLRPNGQATRIQLQLNFTVLARVYNDYYGSIDVENEGSALQNYNRGIPMKYRVNLPVTSPLPRLTSLMVNGHTLCAGPGDVLRPNTYITTFSLQQTSFITYQSTPYKPTSNNTINYGDGIDYGYSPVYTPPVYTPPVYTPPVYTPPVYTPPVYTPAYTEETITRRPVVTYSDLFYDDVFGKPGSQPADDDEIPIRRPVTVQHTDKPPKIPTWRPSQPTSDFKCGRTAISLPLIIKGDDYAMGALPWLVAVYRFAASAYTFTCGGTLVSERHVITAAHCKRGKSMEIDTKSFMVKLGTHNLTDWVSDNIVTSHVSKAVIHEKYNSSSLESDIMIFVLKEQVEYSMYINAACLWTRQASMEISPGTKGVIAGWGQRVDGGTKSDIPQWVEVPILSFKDCFSKSEKLRGITSETSLCAGDRNGAGPCQGDSGGGLYVQQGNIWMLRGVISRALRSPSGGCDLEDYVVLTNVPLFMPWIRKVMSSE